MHARALQPSFVIEDHKRSKLHVCKVRAENDILKKAKSARARPSPSPSPPRPLPDKFPGNDDDADGNHRGGRGGRSGGPMNGASASGVGLVC